MGPQDAGHSFLQRAVTVVHCSEGNIVETFVEAMTNFLLKLQKNPDYTQCCDM
jgi:hypothetical protein